MKTINSWVWLLCHNSDVTDGYGDLFSYWANPDRCRPVSCHNWTLRPNETREAVAWTADLTQAACRIIAKKQTNQDSPYYKWRRCFWQSFSLQCPSHSHLYEMNMIKVGRRCEFKLIRSSNSRPRLRTSERQKTAGREPRSSTMQAARSWGSAGLQRYHGLIITLTIRTPLSGTLIAWSDDIETKLLTAGC